MSRIVNRRRGLTVVRQLATSQVALCIISLLLLSLSLWGQQKKTLRAAVRPQLQKAIGCLVAADYIQQYALKPIGLKIGDSVWVRYEIAPIPGMWRTPGWNIVVYAQSGYRGTLLFVDPNHLDGFEAIRNGYNLVKHNSRWTASGGEGGSGDYEAIGRYVTALSRRPRYRVKLLPGGSECTREQAQ